MHLSILSFHHTILFDDAVNPLEKFQVWYPNLRSCTGTEHARRSERLYRVSSSSQPILNIAQHCTSYTTTSTFSAFAFDIIMSSTANFLGSLYHGGFRPELACGGAALLQDLDHATEQGYPVFPRRLTIRS